MILSQKKIEEIAVAVIRDFQKSFFGSEADDPARFALPTPIDQLGSDLLHQFQHDTPDFGVILQILHGRYSVPNALYWGDIKRKLAE